MKANLAKAQALLNLKKPKTDEAMKLLQPIVNKKNAPWPAFHFSGIAFVQKGEYGMALSFLNEALSQGSDEPETYHAISICYFNMGQYEESEEYANKALDRNPEFFKGWLHLGSLYRAQAKLDDALKCFQKANQIDNSSASVAYRIGEIYNDQGDLNKALELFNITLKIDKGYLNAYLAKADILKKQNKYRESEDTIYEVLSLEPRNVPAKVLLAELHKHEGNYEKAIELYKRLIEQYPKMAGARMNYALCMQELGEFEESEKNYLQAFEDAPTEFESLSNYLMGLHYNPKSTKEEIFEEHKLWDQNFAPAERPARPIPFNTAVDKKLRVGFISGGFRTHPVGWMITKALENLPKDQFETYCYTTHNRYDQITKKIHAATDKWQSVIGYDDKVIARMIREDEIDILVELSGHSADTRLKTVALEPTPVIVKWVGGLFNTTGLKSVDYLITDHQETPAGEEEFYTEKLVRMPDDYICFLPPEYAPDVAALPAKEKDYITFGCFNNPTKVNDEILEKWAEIMNRVPKSKLFLKSKQYDTEVLRERIIETMKACGISEERLKFEGQSPHDELLGSYNSVDIALDPWPYSGGLTTCEALWMGVPVITKPGPTFAGRHSATHLQNAGFPEWIVDTWDKYIEKAVELASDTGNLAEIRTGIREKVANSPVCDGERFGAHLSNAFREMWTQRVKGYEENLPEGDWQDHIEVTPINEEDLDRSKKRKDAMEQVDEIESDFLKKETREVAQKAKNIINGNGTSNGHASHQNGASKKQEEPDTYKIKTKDGVTICTPPDLKMMTPYVLLEQNEWYENELDFIRDYLKTGMNFVDIGAGFGVYALPAAKLIGNEGKVYSFEPGAIAKSHLEKSKLENGLENLEIISKAVAAKAGKSTWEIAETPEMNKLDESGEEEVQVVTLDSWWQFEGEPAVDVMKIDINGEEASALEGGKQLLETEKPLLLLSITEKNSNTFIGSLSELGYAFYEYIPGPGILAQHDVEAGADPYMQNLIAVHESRVDELKENGWLHDETVEAQQTANDLWKTELSNLPWTSELFVQWENHGDSEGINLYLQALNYVIAAEQIEVRNSDLEQPRSQKAVLLLNAAQILIGLYNQGGNSTSVVFTLVRTLNALGKRGQAVEILKKLIETTNMGQQNMNVELPFMLPISEQDKAAIKTEVNKWLMVKTVEAWILLKDWTTYLSGPQERKLIEVLEGNPEVCKIVYQASRITQYLKDGEKNFSSISDLLEDTNLKKTSFTSKRSSYFNSMVNMINKNGPERTFSHDLPGELIVSFTSYPDRFENLPLTLLSLINQTVKPDRIILWIANGDKNALDKEILQFEEYGVEIQFCEDLKSYKKIIPTLKLHPDAFIITADDDLYYNKRWVEGLVRDYENNETVIAHRAHRISFKQNGELKPYKEWGWQYRESFEPSELNFPTSGAGTLYPPGIFHNDVTDTELFQRLSPTADDVWLYFMVKMNGGKFKVSRFEHKLIEWKQENHNTLWKENLVNGKNDEQINNLTNFYGSVFRVNKKEDKFSSKDYWKSRYIKGGNSGAGSYGRLAQFKSEVINSIIEKYDINSIIEFGSGDGNQLKYFKPIKYLGIDVSELAVEKCIRLYHRDALKEFKVLNDYNGETADCSMSLDVIYHLIEEEVYYDYMNELFNASRKIVIIYSSNKDSATENVHVKHREFTKWVGDNKPNWKLIKKIKNKYPFDGDGLKTSFADFYIYKYQD
ncbi:MAG: hypothetical protein CL666_01465 [Balneola sp.]|nr:hypothetical protein [Balneola sp.]